MTEAERITRALPRGKWYGGFGSACCPAHGDKHPSLSLGDGADGRLLLRCHAGCGFGAILDALRGLGLVASDGRRPETDLAEMVRQRAADDAQAAKREAQALACWREASPIGGTLAESYLRARGITCDLPDVLRFHPACWHPSGKRFPALAAMVEGGARFAAHRTYLRPDGGGKAAVEPAKAMLGAVAGGAILDALRGLGLVASDGRRPETDLAEMVRQRAADDAQAAKREAQALACWREASPIGGTLAESYLRARGITCDLPDVLRFHPACWHPSGKRFPALAAMVEGGARFAAHRTYLRPDGGGKAAVEPAKAMLGAVAGGAVRIAAAEGGLVVAEGIETALSLASGLLGRPATIWAALSTSGMMGLVLPPTPGRLTIATDGDAPGRAAGHALATRAAALGWRVSLLPAPEGRDWNDVLALKGAAA